MLLLRWLDDWLYTFWGMWPHSLFALYSVIWWLWLRQLSLLCVSGSLTSFRARLRPVANASRWFHGSFYCEIWIELGLVTSEAYWLAWIFADAPLITLTPTGFICLLHYCALQEKCLLVLDSLFTASKFCHCPLFGAPGISTRAPSTVAKQAESKSKCNGISAE